MEILFYLVLRTSYISQLYRKIIWAASWENQQSAHAKTKAQISFAVTAKLISAFVFATRIVQFLLYLTPKFQASSSFLCLYRPVCVGPDRKPHCWFSHEAAHMFSSFNFLMGDNSIDMIPPALDNGEPNSTMANLIVYSPPPKKTF